MGRGSTLGAQAGRGYSVLGKPAEGGSRETFGSLCDPAADKGNLTLPPPATRRTFLPRRVLERFPKPPDCMSEIFF